jgi:hypothetical protein
VGFVVRPSTDITDARPLPGDESPIGATLPGAAHVPPAWFLTTSTASSAHRLAGLLRPAAGPGVRRVSGRSPPRDGEPFEGFPSSTAVPRHRGRCPRAVTGEMSSPRPRPRNPWPEGHGTGSKLRSAEADPHVDPHARGASTPRYRRGRSTYRGTRGNHDERATRESEAVALQVTGGHGPPKRPGCPVRRTDTTPQANLRAERTDELVETSREAADFEALLRRRVRCVTPPLPAGRHSILPWVLSPPRSADRPLPNGVAAPSGDPSPGSPTETEASEAPGESVR